MKVMSTLGFDPTILCSLFQTLILLYFLSARECHSGFPIVKIIKVKIICHNPKLREKIKKKNVGASFD